MEPLEIRVAAPHSPARRVAVTMRTPLGRVLGPKTATSMSEQLGLETVADLHLC